MTFNQEAAAENLRNEKAVTITEANGMTTLIIDARRATYKGIKAIDLSDENKRKLENLVLFTHIQRLHQIPKIIYR